MRLHLEAADDELREKAHELVKALVENIEDCCPDIEAVFQKALGSGADRPMKFPMLEELREESQAIFRELSTEMIEEIVAVVLHEAPK